MVFSGSFRLPWSTLLVATVLLLLQPPTLLAFNLWQEDLNEALRSNDARDEAVEQGQSRFSGEQDEEEFDDDVKGFATQTMSSWQSSGMGGWTTHQTSSSFTESYNIPWESTFETTEGVNPEDMNNAVSGELNIFSTFVSTYIYSQVNYWRSSGVATFRNHQTSTWTSSGSSWSTVIITSHITEHPPPPPPPPTVKPPPIKPPTVKPPPIKPPTIKPPPIKPPTIKPPPIKPPTVRPPPIKPPTVKPPPVIPTNKPPCDEPLSVKSNFWISSGMQIEVSTPNFASQWTQSWENSWTGPVNSWNKIALENRWKNRLLEKVPTRPYFPPPPLLAPLPPLVFKLNPHRVQAFCNKLESSPLHKRKATYQLVETYCRRLGNGIRIGKK